MVEIESLVRREIIAAAQENHRASAARLDSAKAAHTLNERYLADARAAEDQVITKVARGEAKPQTLSEASASVAPAERAVGISRRLLDAAQQAYDEAVTALHAAPGLAWQPVHDAGVAESLAAAQDYENGLAVQLAAVARFRNGIGIMRQAERNDCATLAKGASYEPERHSMFTGRPPKCEWILKTPEELKLLWEIQ